MSDPLKSTPAADGFAMPAEYAPHEGSAAGAALLPPLHTTGIKAAVFDFLFLHNNTAAWDVSAHFPNHAGLTLLGRRARAA